MPQALPTHCFRKLILPRDLLYYRHSFLTLFPGNAIFQRKTHSTRSPRARRGQWSLEWVQARAHEQRDIAAQWHRERTRYRDQRNISPWDDPEWRQLWQPQWPHDVLASLVPWCDSQAEDGAKPSRPGE